MKTKRKYKSSVLGAIHSSANALLDIGAIDKAILHDFDDSFFLLFHQSIYSLIPRLFLQEQNHNLWDLPELSCRGQGNYR